jgi:hypothetical protein
MATSAALLGGGALAQPPEICIPGVTCPSPPVIWGHYPTLWRRWPGAEEGPSAAASQPPAAMPGIDQELRTIVPERSDGSDLLESQLPGPQDEGLPQPMGQDAPPAPPGPLATPMRLGRHEQAIGRRLRSISGQTRTAVQLASLDRSASTSRDDTEDIWGDLAVDVGWQLAEGSNTSFFAPPAAAGNPLRTARPATQTQGTPAPSSALPAAVRTNPLR